MRPPHAGSASLRLRVWGQGRLLVVPSGEVQLRSFVEAHDLGVVVDRTDPSSIAEGLQGVLTDDAARARGAEAGPAAVRETFSVARVGQQLRALYADAAA